MSSNKSINEDMGYLVALLKPPVGYRYLLTDIYNGWVLFWLAFGFILSMLYDKYHNAYFIAALQEASSPKIWNIVSCFGMITSILTLLLLNLTKKSKRYLKLIYWCKHKTKLVLLLAFNIGMVFLSVTTGTLLECIISNQLTFTEKLMLPLCLIFISAIGIVNFWMWWIAYALCDTRGVAPGVKKLLNKSWQFQIGFYFVIIFSMLISWLPTLWNFFNKKY